MQVLNICILWAKYYIYIQRLFNNKKNDLDLCECLAQVKLAFEIEYNICKNSTTTKRLSNNYMTTYNKNT